MLGKVRMLRESIAMRYIRVLIMAKVRKSWVSFLQEQMSLQNRKHISGLHFASRFVWVRSTLVVVGLESTIFCLSFGCRLLYLRLSLEPVVLHLFLLQFWWCYILATP
ncbi:hypothetical protein vseg_002114 [Gypsophila vaccaria]